MTNRWQILILACALHGCLIGGAYMSLPPLFETISASSDWSLSALNRAWSLIPLGSCLAALVTAYLSGSIPVTRMLRISVAVVILSTLGRSVAYDPTLFALTLLLFGVGTGTLLVVLTNLISQTFSERELGLAQAAFFSSYALGAALGLVSAHPISSYCGDWRMVPLLWSFVSFVVASPVLIGRFRYPAPKPTKNNHAGHNLTSEPALWRYSFIYACYVGAYLGIAGMAPAQLRQWGFSPSVADSSIALSTVFFLVGAFLWGILTDRYGYRRITFFGCMMASCACTALIPLFVYLAHPLLVVTAIVGIGLFGGAMSLFFPMMLEDDHIGPENSSFSIGIATTASYIGGFLIPFFASPLVNNSPFGALFVFATAYACAGLAVLRRVGKLSVVESLRS